MCDTAIMKTITLYANLKIQISLQSNFIGIDLRRYAIGRVFPLDVWGLDFDLKNSHKNVWLVHICNPRTEPRVTTSAFLGFPSHLAKLASTRSV